MASVRHSINDPAQIFAGSSLLWVDAYKGAYLRDGGGAAPDNGEVVATAVDRGTVGNCLSAGGVGLTYDATAFGGRGGLACVGGVNDWLLSPVWTLASRCSGIVVWRAAAGSVGVWGHGTINTRMCCFWSANQSIARRIDGAAGLQAQFAMPAATNFWSSFRLQNPTGETWGPGGLSGASAVVAAIPGTAAATGIAAASDAGAIPFAGVIGEVVLVDAVMSEAQRASLQAYVVAKWGLAP